MKGALGELVKTINAPNFDAKVVNLSAFLPKWMESKKWFEQLENIGIRVGWPAAITIGWVIYWYVFKNAIKWAYIDIFY